MTTTAIDSPWRLAHPIATHQEDIDKNARGRVLLVGGGLFVPGALRLTGEAALRAGAGKLQMATVEAAATALGVLVPEAAMIALPAYGDGEIAAAAAALLAKPIARCDTLILGPGMREGEHTDELVRAALGEARDDLSILLDAAAISCAGTLDDVIAGHGGRVVLTPHHGEMAALTGCDRSEIARDPEGAARAAARRFNAIVVLKAGETYVAAPDGSVLLYTSDCVGLATGGSGDVLAGIIGGLMARGTPPLAAAGWGVWLHGEAGQAAAAKIGPIGFLARDLLVEVPGLMVVD
jgi:ADP-dependent NAD(P)H-hydrate dehydratase